MTKTRQSDQPLSAADRDKAGQDLLSDDSRPLGTPVKDKEEYLVASQATIPGVPGSGPVDRGDYDAGWTVASEPLVAPQDVPGQVFTPEQLPDPRIAARAGFPPLVIPEHLIVEGDDAQGHPGAPEPWEQGRSGADVHKDVLGWVEESAADNAKANDRSSKSSKKSEASTQ